MPGLAPHCLRPAAIALLLPLVLAAQIHGPVAGYFLETETNLVHPVLGVPGAATVGSALELDYSVTGVEFPANRSNPMYALVTIAGEHDGCGIMRFASPSEAVTTLIPDCGMQASTLALSTSGTTGAVFARATRILQVLCGLPSRPRVCAESYVDLPGELTGMAAQGRSVLVVMKEQDSTASISRVYRAQLTRGEIHYSFVAEAGDISDVVFGGTGRRYFFADRALDLIFQADVTDGADSVSVLATNADGIDEPIRLRVQPGGLLLVANKRGRSVTVLDPRQEGAGRAVQLRLSHEPDACDFFGLENTVLLNKSARETIYVLEVGQEAPTVFFIGQNTAATDVD